VAFVRNYDMDDPNGWEQTQERMDHRFVQPGIVARVYLCQLSMGTSTNEYRPMDCVQP
jgi:hypothetical protein